MQIFCVIPHTHASNYGFMTGSYLPLVERFFLDGLVCYLHYVITMRLV